VVGHFALLLGEKAVGLLLSVIISFGNNQEGRFLAKLEGYGFSF